MTKGYWIVHITVTDPSAFETYRQVVGAALAAYGGRFLVRAGSQTVAEGALPPRTVVIEFPSYDDALTCYASPAYQAAKAVRLAAADVQLAIVEGWNA